MLVAGVCFAWGYCSTARKDTVLIRWVYGVLRCEGLGMRESSQASLNSRCSLERIQSTAVRALRRTGEAHELHSIHILAKPLTGDPIGLCKWVVEPISKGFAKLRRRNVLTSRALELASSLSIRQVIMSCHNLYPASKMCRMIQNCTRL